MSAVTTGGEAAKSIYSSDIQQSFLFAKAKNKQAPASFSYPEWFSKRSTYSSDHCTLFEIKSLVTASATTKLRVEKKYRHLICQHETELDRILNQPTWLKRQNEGTELDIDE
ncbi:MAG: hypothetical protein KDD37_09675, partial [Bdellovibrionales bacterium]|nr:hypothetical protein [Bdellovibrionales bacterium]